MKTIIKTSIAGILFLLTVACEKIVTNVDLPDYEAKLVVQCFLSPENENIEVFVSESVPIFSTTQPGSTNSIINATVRLEGPGQNMILPFSEVKQRYILPASSFSVVGGETYRLYVSVPDGRQVKGSTTVPLALSQNLEITELEELPGGYGEYKLAMRMQDMPGEGNFYRVTAYQVFEDAFIGGSTYTWELYFDKGETLVSDQGRDSYTFTYRSTFYCPDCKELQALLLTTDEAYYRYHKSVYGFNGDDPFSEPVIVYSNIEGGLGVFSSYRQFKITRQL